MRSSSSTFTSLATTTTTLAAVVTTTATNLVSTLFSMLLLVLAILSTTICCTTTTTFVSATPTEPVQVNARDLPENYLVRNSSDGSLRIMISAPTHADDVVVATLRSADGSFRTATGWGYFQVRSRPTSFVEFETPTSAAGGGPLSSAKMHHNRRHRHRRGNKKTNDDNNLDNLNNKRHYISPTHSTANPAYVTNGSQYYYWGGFAEGIVEATYGRADRVLPKPSYGKCQDQWLQAHFEYFEGHLQKYSSSSPNNNNNNQDQLTIFWQQQIRIWNQLEGIADGINQFNNSDKNGAGWLITARDVYLHNFNMYSLNQRCMLEERMRRNPHQTLKDIENEDLRLFKRNEKERVPQHCSGLVRATANEIFASQTTWYGFAGYIAERVFKAYSFGNEATVTLSSSPLLVSSEDDWYQIRGRYHQMSALETTDNNFNTSLWIEILPASVPEFIRIMAANYVCTTPQQWASWYDGSLGVRPAYSYINSYLITSFDMFIPGQPLKDGTIWSSEITPGYGRSHDVTWFVRENGYFPSFNIYYDSFLYNISGYAEMEAEQGQLWSWTKYARPQIFKAYAPQVQTMADMQRMMRWNKYKNSNFSVMYNCSGATAGGPNKCSPTHTAMFAIASRGDLMTLYPTVAENIAHYGFLWQDAASGCMGATDCKIASSSGRFNLNAYIINGPTNDDVPTFNWSGPCAGMKPPNAPSVVDFPWISVTPEL